MTQFSTSKSKATIGRVVHAYCPDLWKGPQPAIITRVAAKPNNEDGIPTHLDRYDQSGDGTPTTVQGDAQLVNANVLVDAGSHPDALKYFREADTGNTLVNAPLFDAQSDEDRLTICSALTRPISPIGPIGERTPVVWLEWPEVAKPAGEVKPGRIVDPGPLLSRRPDEPPTAWQKAGDDAMKKAISEGKPVREAEELALAAARAASKPGDPYFVEPTASNAAKS